MTDFPLNPQELSSEIGIPLDDWPGKCHQVASAVLQMVPVEGMRLARGHYTGPVSRKSVYRGGGIQQHTWLVAKDGRIVDPTRWAIDRPNAPYIYIGVSDYYDEAGIGLAAKLPPLLPRGACGLAALLSQKNISQLNRIARAIGACEITSNCADSRDVRQLTSSLKYALISDPSHHDDPREFYQSMEDAGLKVLIKIDLWNVVMQPEKCLRQGPANRYFSLPDFTRPTKAQLFFDLCSHFIRIEERGEQLNDELEEYGVALEDWWDTLNKVERFLKFAPAQDLEGFEYFPKDHLNSMVIVSDAILGSGFGEALKVERYAASLGYSRNDLDEVMREAGAAVHYRLMWI